MAAMLDDVTPVVLTYNEAPNLARNLDRLRWAKRVLVVDSHSTDDTVSIAERYDNVQVLVRSFDTFEGQLNYVIDSGELTTEWMLTLDADYMLTDALVDELRQLQPAADCAGYRARFVYCVNGAPLRGSLYPPAVVLIRHRRARYFQDGHAYRVTLEGQVVELDGRIEHDDRKPLSRWLKSQLGYAQQEARKLHGTPLGELSWPDRIRRVPFASVPLAVGYCLFYRGCALDGAPGLFYTAQRGVAEAIISVRMLEHRLRGAGGDE